MTPQRTSRISWSDPAVLRALLLAGLVILAVLLPLAFGAPVLGSPTFDITPDPAGPLPF